MLGDRKKVYSDCDGLGMRVELDPAQTCCSFPEEWIAKSDTQRTLERNGCLFRGQERLDSHEVDIEKECYCGRPKRKYGHD